MTVTPSTVRGGGARELILASTSPYRRQLLERLGLPFRVVAPDIDEGPLRGESPHDLVGRLSREKAQAVAARHRGALVVASDQVAVLDGRILGKPGSAEANVRQLADASGRRLDFLTGVCLLDADDGSWQVDVVPFSVRLRTLARARIERYVALERAFDCAGGFRCEGLGVALFESMHGEDPTALVGLPLIRLVEMLARVGVDPLAPG